MNCVLGGVLLSLLDPTPATAADRQAPQATAQEQYQSLVREYQQVTSAPPDAATAADRQGAAASLEALPARFLALAEQHPDDAVALDALAKVVFVENNTGRLAAGPDAPGRRAFALLQRDHLRSERLGPVCLEVAGSPRPEAEAFLRAALDANGKPPGRALASLALVEFLANRLRLLDALADQPDYASRYRDVLDEQYLAELRRRDRGEAGKEVEARYEQVAADYPDVPVPYGGTVGARAKAALYELRHLAVGQPAPEVEGEDQDGVSFRLSDYRGKVVLLDFWQQT